MQRVSGDARAVVLAKYSGSTITTVDDFAKALNNLSEAELRTYAGEIWPSVQRKALSDAFALGDTLDKWFGGDTASPELLNLIRKALITNRLSPPHFSGGTGAPNIPNPERDTSYVITSRDVSLAAARQLAISALIKKKSLYFIIVAGNEDEMPYLAFQSSFRDEIQQLKKRNAIPSSSVPNIMLYRTTLSSTGRTQGSGRAGYSLFYATFIGALMQMRGKRQTRVYLCESNAAALTSFEETLKGFLSDTKVFRPVLAERLPLVGPLRLDERDPVSWVRPLFLSGQRDSNLDVVPDAWKHLLSLSADKLQEAVLRDVLTSLNPSKQLRMYRELLCLHRYADGYFPALIGAPNPLSSAASASEGTGKLMLPTGVTRFAVYQLDLQPLLLRATSWEGIMGLREANMMFASLLRSHEVSDSFNILQKSFTGATPTQIVIAGKRDDYARWIASEYLAATSGAATQPLQPTQPLLQTRQPLVARQTVPVVVETESLPRGLQPSSIGRQIASRDVPSPSSSPSPSPPSSPSPSPPSPPSSPSPSPPSSPSPSPSPPSSPSPSRSPSPSLSLSSRTLTLSRPSAPRSSLLSQSSSKSPPSYHRD